MKQVYSNDELLSIIQQFFNEHGRVPKARELPASKEVYRLRFGSYNNAIKLLNLPLNRRTSDELMRHTCHHCHVTFKSHVKNRKYCSRSCSVSANNKARERAEAEPTNTCIVCTKPHNNLLYCSVQCRHLHIKNQYTTGELCSRPALRKQINATCCMMCGLSKWNGVPLSLELDHIDGDAGNNTPSNLRMICPNCHSTTPTWKSRNKGNGRKARGLSTA